MGRPNARGCKRSPRAPPTASVRRNEARLFRAGIENRISLGVVADEIARPKVVEHARPAMSVNRNGVARLDAGIEDP